ncbi:protein PAXX isoform X2 [Scophthalmus maximus]|uniref:protein PAXX isoform X2 n=1 Tax=Scophthalmus maximus TaxID=52904 RepID=UPI001FA861DA|nr:protein PAXX isoform X2 [Scophthalmus maximus]
MNMNMNMNVEASQTSYCTVLDGKSRCKYVCYTRRRNDGAFCVCLTDAADVWSTEYTEDALSQFRQRFALKSTEDYLLKLRSACGSGDVSVVVHDAGAELRVGSGPGALSVGLSRLEGQQAAEELRELLFRMADSIAQLDSKFRPPTVSPVKNSLRHQTDFEPRQQQSCAPSVTVKRRAPGASLINPGTKKFSSSKDASDWRGLR